MMSDKYARCRTERTNELTVMPSDLAYAHVICILIGPFNGMYHEAATILAFTGSTDGKPSIVGFLSPLLRLFRFL